MIDPHVHLRDWSQSDKETVLHGMSVAARLGFTHLFDMPNTAPACTSRSVVLERLALGGEASEKTGVSYHLYAGITNDESQIEEVCSLYSELFPLVVGLKMFARPAIAETESVKDLVSLALETGFEGTLHICHVSAKSTIEYVKTMRSKLHITMGATPHHALLSRKDAETESLMLKMNPPLRSEEDRNAVFSALLDGTIDWAESDHAPHTIEDKRGGASGIPGLPGMDLLLSRLRASGCTEERLKAAFGGNVQRVFGLDGEDIVLPEDPYGLYEAERNDYPVDPYSSIAK